MLKNRKTKPPVFTGVGDGILNGEKKQVLQVRIDFPEQAIVYNRLPSKEWFYLFSKTKKFVIITPEGEGMARDIATFPNIDFDTSIGEKLGFGV